MAGGARKALAGAAAERRALMEGLNKLNDNMVTLAELSEIAIRKAAESLARLDPGAADEVFTLDNEIYALQLQIEKTCGELLALYAPVARDLRTITTSLKITTDFDRIGRYAKDIAEIALQLKGASQALYERLETLHKMVDITIDMVDRATEAFVRRDPDSVRDIGEVDDVVDELEIAIHDALVSDMKDGMLPIDIGTRYVLVTRYLERIADHAVNIGERVVYMVTGERAIRERAAVRARRKAP